MYLVCATQYPTNASIPSVIRQQMRRIGMKCRDGMSSQVVIGQPGLEKVKVLGAGMLEPKGSNQYRMFRSFYAADGDPDYGQKNDILDVLATIPTNKLPVPLLRLRSRCQLRASRSLTSSPTPRVVYWTRPLRVANAQRIRPTLCSPGSSVKPL